MIGTVKQYRKGEIMLRVCLKMLKETNKQKK